MDSTTKTKLHNPLEKLPVLYSDETEPVYESSFILEWVEANYPPPKYPAIFPAEKSKELLAKQIQVITDGMCDACVLMFFEKQREHPSQEWKDRQMRKLEGGMKALSKYVGQNEFIVDNKFGLADIAAGSVLGYLKVRFESYDWQSQYPNLKKYNDGLETRQSFKDTVPYPQTISDKIV